MPMTLRGGQAFNGTCGRAFFFDVCCFVAYAHLLGYGFCIVPKNWALASIYEEIIINIGCIYDQSHFEIIMSTIQNSHKDSNY